MINDRHYSRRARSERDNVRGYSDETLEEVMALCYDLQLYPLELITESVVAAMARERQLLKENETLNAFHKDVRDNLMKACVNRYRAAKKEMEEYDFYCQYDLNLEW